MLTLGSLFDGIGGFPLAAQRHGIKPIWASEIEPNCIAITKRHFPDMLHLGDITKIGIEDVPSVDIITFGSPCQDLSVAGKRAGLEGERSGLFHTAIQLIRGLRERDGKPEIIVWENVPGAFSSSKGMDFRAMLAEIGQAEIPMPENGRWANAGMAELPSCEIAWRVLNAQYWGVPQRRRRIFLVADFAGRRAAKILFESEGLRGNPAESGAAGKDAAAGTGKSVKAKPIYAVDMGGGKSNAGVSENLAPTLTTTHGGEPCIYDMSHACDVIRKGDIPTPQARMGTGGNQIPLVIQNAAGFTYKATAKAGSIGYADETAPTIATDGKHGVVYSIEGNGSRPPHKGLGVSESGTMYTLNTIEQHAVCYGIGRDVFNAETNAKFGMSISENIQPTITAKGAAAVSENNIVRRLTPLEAERLQGFPDGYTDGFSDTARYRALGNSVAVPCVEFIMRRIQKEW